MLDGQRELFAAELALTQTRRDQRVAVVRVYKALGGAGRPGTGGGSPPAPKAPAI